MEAPEKRIRVEDVQNNPAAAVETNPNDVVKILLQQEPKKTAALLGRFEQVSSRLRQFVQERQLWMLLFQKAFPEHYDDAAVAVPLNDGTGRMGVGMKQSIKDMLDRYS